MNTWQQSQVDGIPEGFVQITTDDGQHYIVPPFMIPATHQAMEAYRQKLQFDVQNADRGVSFYFNVLDGASFQGRCRCHAGGRCRVCLPLPCLHAAAVSCCRCRVWFLLPCLPCLLANSLYTPTYSSFIFSLET